MKNQGGSWEENSNLHDAYKYLPEIQKLLPEKYMQKARNHCKSILFVQAKVQ